ncbi:MAG TPA: transcriptional regulator [Bradyrhizobium sp.]|jgi:hypothetical protein
MAQQAWRSGNGERRWLSRLIDTMERVSRRETRAQSFDSSVLGALRLQLARPASPHPYWYVRKTSHFGLRN